MIQANDWFMISEEVDGYYFGDVELDLHGDSKEQEAPRKPRTDSFWIVERDSERGEGSRSDFRGDHLRGDPRGASLLDLDSDLYIPPCGNQKKYKFLSKTIFQFEICMFAGDQWVLIK